MDDDQHFSFDSFDLSLNFSETWNGRNFRFTKTRLLSNSESIDFNDLLGKWIDSRFEKNSAPGSLLKKTILIQQKNV